MGEKREAENVVTGILRAQEAAIKRQEAEARMAATNAAAKRSRVVVRHTPLTQSE